MVHHVTAGTTRCYADTDAWCYTVSWPFGGSCKPGCPCPARVVIGKGLGWEIGWQAHRERWTRLIAITRWLGAAHHVEKQPLYGEDMDYDCLKALEEGKTVAPSNGRCWGDAGNGVQIGWFVSHPNCCMAAQWKLGVSLTYRDGPWAFAGLFGEKLSCAASLDSFRPSQKFPG